MPIESGASWFSPKGVEAPRQIYPTGGRALVRCGRRKSVPNRVKLRIPVASLSGSESARDKFRTQEGNSPDYRLRSQNSC